MTLTREELMARPQCHWHHSPVEPHFCECQCAACVVATSRFAHQLTLDSSASIKLDRLYDLINRVLEKLQAISVKL